MERGFLRAYCHGAGALIAVLMRTKNFIALLVAALVLPNGLESSIDGAYK